MIATAEDTRLAASITLALGTGGRMYRIPEIAP
jgi:hypothetical protein